MEPPKPDKIEKNKKSDKGEKAPEAAKAQKAPDTPKASPQPVIANFPVKSHINSYGFIGLSIGVANALTYR